MVHCLLLGLVTLSAQVDQASEGVKGIFHLVGIVQHSRTAAAEITEINVQGTVNVVEAAARAARLAGGRVPPKVVFASTSGTVAVRRTGDEARGDSDDFADDLVRNWPYYASKVLVVTGRSMP